MALILVGQSQTLIVFPAGRHFIESVLWPIQPAIVEQSYSTSPESAAQVSQWIATSLAKPLFNSSESV